jgi:hypothetical protein
MADVQEGGGDGGCERVCRSYVIVDAGMWFGNNRNSCNNVSVLDNAIRSIASYLVS